MRVALTVAALTICLTHSCGPAQATPAERALAVLCPHAVEWAPFVEAAARRQLMHPALIVAVMRAESGCTADAVSARGAVGAMQLLGVARGRLRGAALRDPEANIDAGARWLCLMITWCGSVPLGVGAYNTGKCGRGRGYARRVMRLFERAFQHGRKEP